MCQTREAVRIAVIGDYTPQFESHPATTDAIRLAANALGLEVSVEWMPTPGTSEGSLGRYDGLWAAPGSPYQSFEGMLRAIRLARERQWPFVGT